MADPPARFYLCARCRQAVLLCSDCDRGQIYCGKECSRAARKSAQCEAARRYQNSRRGRVAHAARAHRWRQRRREGLSSSQSATHADKEIVTHQGCAMPCTDVSLQACLTKSCNEHSPVSATRAQALWLCQNCAKEVSSWVRQGFLRRGVVTRRMTRSYDFSP